MGFKDRLGKVQFAVSMEISKMQEAFLCKSSQLDSYKALQKIEKYFDVRFLYPYPDGLTQEEADFANLLIDFINSEDIAFTADARDGNFFIAHNRNEITHAGQIGLRNGTIATTPFGTFASIPSSPNSSLISFPILPHQSNNESLLILYFQETYSCR